MNVVNLSGGKDSCATALVMMENNISIDLLVHADVGAWEFPETRFAVEQIAALTGVPLISLKTVPFDWWMNERIVLKRDGTYTIGSGWPSREHGRWCTREKFVVVDKLMKTLENPVKCIGFALDECERTESKEQIKRRKAGELFRYPLIEYGLTEEDALQLCYRNGIDWNGLYEIFRTDSGRTPRLSCWCCPHQPLEALRILRKRFPHYWQRMLEMHRITPQKIFKGWSKDGTDVTVQDLEDRFAAEDLVRLAA